MRHWLIRLALPALLTAPTAAQLEGKTALGIVALGSGLTSTSAAINLGMTVDWTVNEQTFYTKFNSKPWDLLIIDMPEDSIITDKAKFADAVADYIASGGRVLCNFTNLDEHPKLQQVLGVAGTVEKLKPYRVYSPPPGNPIWLANDGLPLALFPPPWDDYGDDLVPAAGSLVAALSESPGNGPAILLAHDQRVFVNGFDWESLQGNPFFAIRQIKYLFACRGDFDKNGTLDVFDYIEFVKDFQHPTLQGYCNYDFSTTLDVFDFLEFINEFVKGCM